MKVARTLPAKVTILLMLLATLCAHLYLTPTTPFLDEGDHANTGLLIAHGKQMYTDAFNEKGPGLYWISALLFRIFGERFSVLRHAATAGMLLSLCLLVALAARLRGWNVAALSAALFVGFHLFFLGKLWQSESVLTPIALALIFLLVEEKNGAKKPIAKLITAGLLLFIATIIKQTSWLLVLAPIIFFLFGNKKKSTRALPLLIGLALPWAVTIGFILYRGVCGDFVEGYLFPIAGFGVAAYSTMPSGAEFFLEFPVWAMAAATLLSGRTLADDPADRLLIRSLLCATIVMIFPAIFAHHFLPVLPIAAFGFSSFVLAGRQAEKKTTRFISTTAVILLIIIAAAFAPRQYRDRVGTFGGGTLSNVVKEIQAQVPQGRSLMVFPHDSSLYFLSNRQPPGRYGFLLPWTTPKVVLERFMGEVKNDPPGAVIYTYLSNCTPDRLPPEKYLAPFLSFLTEHYRVGKVFENRMVLLVPLGKNQEGDLKQRCRMEKLFHSGMSCFELTPRQIRHRLASCDQ